MKKLFLSYKIIAFIIAILFSISEINAQCTIDIEGDVTQPVCYQTNLVLSTGYNANYNYEWSHNGQVIESHVDGNKVKAEVTVTTDGAVYNLSVTDAASGAPICNPSITIAMKKNFTIAFEQLEMTCSNDNLAQIKATASGNGFTDFTYHWNIEDSQLLLDPQVAVNLKAYYPYSITVTNNDNDCWQTDTVRAKAFMNPRITIKSEPDSVVYLDNPYVTWTYTNDEFQYKDDEGTQHDTIIEMSNPNPRWQFEGHTNSINAERAEVSFSSVGAKYARLTITTDEGCDTTYVSSIKVDPVNLKIPNIFTPNGDGINDYFEIGYGEDGKPINDLNRYFLSHRLVIFNRWGKVIYESKDYKNDWDGDRYPDGTYFYVLECKGETDNYRYQGSVMIWNSGR